MLIYTHFSLVRLPRWVLWTELFAPLPRQLYILSETNRSLRGMLYPGFLDHRCLSGKNKHPKNVINREKNQSLEFKNYFVILFS